MRWILIYAVAAGALLCGQEKLAAVPYAQAAESAALVVRIVDVKNANPDEVFRTLNNLGLGVNMTRTGNSILLSGPPARVQVLEETIHKLDVPSQPKKDIEVIGYLVLASRAPGENGDNIPAELDRVVSQFKSLLAYRTFRLLDTIQVRGHEGSIVESTGILSLSPGSKPMDYHFRFMRAEVEGSNIHLHDLLLKFAGGVISTDVDIQPNQKVAVGKASVDPNGDALILVISAKVVD